jgi:hypothetical protein
MKPQREPFAKFARFNKGIPKLLYCRNPKTAHVQWGDGSMWHYLEFKNALDHESMERELHECFQRDVKARLITTNRTVLAYGGAHGAITYAPHAAADAVYRIVLHYFSKALQTVADRIETHTTYLDKILREKTGELNKKVKNNNPPNKQFPHRIIQ